MSRKDRFKVYSNSNMPKKKQEEIEVSLELLDEEVMAGLFLTSPYFMDMITREDYFYYPVDLEAEETMLAPIMNKNVLREFVEKAEPFCVASSIPMAALLHVEGSEDDEEDMVSLTESKLQMEILKFFRTAVSVMNPEIAMDESFEDIFDQLIDEVEDNGYLDRVLSGILEFMSEPEFLEEMLFAEEE